MIYLDFGIPLLQRLKESLDEKIVFQSVLHGITRGHSHTPYHAGVLCGTAIVLAYTRGVLTHKDLPYPEGELDEFKRELENHKQEFISRVAIELCRLLTPFTLLEHLLMRIRIVQAWRKEEINTLSQDINNLLVNWG